MIFSDIDFVDVAEADSSQPEVNQPRRKKRRVIPAWRIPTPSETEISLADVGSVAPVHSSYDVDRFDDWIPFIRTFWACGSPATYEPQCNLDGSLDGARSALRKMGDLTCHPVWASFFEICKGEGWFLRFARLAIGDGPL